MELPARRRPSGAPLLTSIAIATLLGAAFVPPARVAAAVALLGGLLVARFALGRLPPGWTATLPVGVSLAWPAILGADAPLGAVACADPLSEIALKRVGVAVVVLGLTAFLAWALGASRAELGLVSPRRLHLGLAAAGLVTVAVGGLVIGPALAEPFFGRFAFARPIGAIVPALIFGVANASLEEIVYRGVLQRWLGRIIGLGPAIVLQALVFGVVHVGPEVTDLVALHVALMAGAGLLAGLVAARTGSLAIPIGVHVGADVALYFGLACRGPFIG